jgi:hypothetical protein
MPFRTVTTSHEVDLDLPADERWLHVTAGRRPLLRRLLRRALQDARAVFDYAPPATRALELATKAGLRAGYRIFGGRYADEMAFFADAAGVSIGDVLLANCSYELLSLVESSPFGCTSGIATHVVGGPVLVRSMDWGLNGLLGDASSWHEFREGGRTFVTLGVPGLVGVLQGMVPGAWAACLNYAPAAELPGFDFGPVFLLRHALETCDTYHDALRLLRDEPLSAAAFFTLVGTTPVEACVIERRRRDAAVRRPRCTAIAAANDHVVARLRSWNDADYEADSTRRRAAIAWSLQDLSASSDIRQCLRAANGRPVTNELTEQRVAFQPATGERAASVRCAHTR